jgi:hypothetical protein
MSGSLASLGVVIGGGPNGDAEELDRLAAELREELLDLDVDAVERVTAESAPAGAKGAAGDAAGSLLVTLSDSAVLVSVVGLLRSWIGRARGRTVTVQYGQDRITIGQASAEEVAALIGSWMARHAQQ